jgi:hypothetical protein
VILPNANSAIVDIKKLEGYCLNTTHPLGKHKAKVFKSVLGITINESKLLRAKLKEIVSINDSVFLSEDDFGKRYFIDFKMEINKKKAFIRSIWIIRSDENFPRFVTCYIK